MLHDLLNAHRIELIERCRAKTAKRFTREATEAVADARHTSFPRPDHQDAADRADDRAHAKPHGVRSLGRRSPRVRDWRRQRRCTVASCSTAGTRLTKSFTTMAISARPSRIWRSNEIGRSRSTNSALSTVASTTESPTRSRSLLCSATPRWRRGAISAKANG